MDDLFQKLSSNWLGLGVLILLIGVPYVLRAWKEIMSHQQELANAKLQMEILRACMDLGLDDPESLDRIRGIAKRVAFDERLLGSPEQPPQELVPLVIGCVVSVATFSAGAYASFRFTAWLYIKANILLVIAYAFIVAYRAYRYAKRKTEAGEQAHPIFGPLLGGAALGGIVGLILATMVQRELASY